MPLRLITGFMAAFTFAWVQSSSAQEQPASGAGETDAMERITVTTELRAQDIQDVAGAVQSFAQDDLYQDGIGSEFRNLQFSVPGLNIANQEGNLEIFIRGIGSANGTELGDPAVATHINGVYIPRPRGIGSQFFDIERVEIHKGPQGTLRGRNAVGGSVNIVTARPELGEVTGYATAGLGLYSERTYEAALNLPLGDTAAIRFAGFSQNHESYFNNAGPIRGLAPAGKEDEHAARISFLWEPSDRLSYNLIADYTNERGTGYPGSPVYEAFTMGFGFDDIDPRDVVYRGPQGRLDNEVYGVTSILNYDFDWVEVELLNSFRSIDYYQLSGNVDGTAYPGRDLTNPADFDNYGAVYFLTRSDAWVNELRFSAPDHHRFRWTAGAFRLDESQESGFFSLNDNGVFFSGVEFSMPIVDVKSTAGFADATFDVTDVFRVKGGVRYTTEYKYRFGIGGNWTLGLGADAGGCCFATRLGTDGFVPFLNERPNFIAPTTPAEVAQFFFEGANFGANDTLVQQLQGIIGGTAPNGTCIDTPDTDPNDNLDCPANGQHSFLVLTGPGQQVGEVKSDFVDWRIGGEWDLSENSLLYATISTGTKAAGFNDNVSATIAPTFDSEELLAYEIGSKNTFQVMGERLVANAFVFYYDYDELVQQSLVQVGGTGGPLSSGFALSNDNVADARILGFEFQVAMSLPHGFEVSAQGSFLDTKVQDGTLADVRGQDFGVNDPNDADLDGCTNVCQTNLEGNQLPLASDFQLILKLKQEFKAWDGMVDWQVLANYRSDYYLSILNEDPIVRPVASDLTALPANCQAAPTSARACGFAAEQDGFWTVNLSAGYTSDDERWRVEGYISNLFDTDSSQKALLGNSLNLRFLNLPRTGGVRLTVRF